MKIIFALLDDSRGHAAIEYVIIASVIGTGLVAVIRTLGPQLAASLAGVGSIFIIGAGP